MMRTGFFFEKVCDFSHLFKAFKRAFKGSSRSRQASEFNFHAEKEILKLKDELLTGIYQPGPYTYFKIQDPKERLISVAPFRDRVVHHAVVSAIEALYEKTFIFDSYATRKGKGFHPAIERAQVFSRKNRYYLKMDIKKYFYHIDSHILLELLKRKIKDKKFLMLAEKIIMNGGRGLPIGNLTSQFFANVYLNPLDHYTKEKLSARYYIRYMDDFVLFSNSIDELKSRQIKIEQFLKMQLKLVLKTSAVVLNRSDHGLDFLGVRIFPNLKRIKSSSLKRIQHHINITESDFKKGILSETAYAEKMNSFFNHIGFADSFQLRSRLIKECSQ